MLEIVILSDGPVSSPRTNSGVARGIYEALAAHPRVRVVDAIDSAFHKKHRLVVRALTVRPTRRQWDRAASWGVAGPLIRSVRRSIRGRKRSRRGEIALHVRNLYLPSRYPYAAFIDTTQSLRGDRWPEPGMRPRHYAVLRLIERFYLRGAQAVFVASDDVRREVVRRYKVDPAKVKAVGAGLTVNWPDRLPSRDERLGPVNILFVGKDFRRKGGDQLLAAIAGMGNDVPAVRLHVVGPDRSEVMEHERVIAHGLVSDPDTLRSLYEAADVFCLPALFEPFGLVVLEAMAFGLPLVVSDVGALPDLARGSGGGVVVAAGDVVGLQAALERLIRDSDYRLQLGEAARRAAAGMTWAAVAGEMVEALIADESSH